MAVDAGRRHRRGRPALAVGAAGHGDDRRRLGARPAAGRRPRRRSPPRRSSRSTRCSCGSARRRARTRCSRCWGRCRRCSGCARWRSRARAGRLLAWGAVAALALATHYYAIFLVGPQALWLACALPGLRERAAALALPLAAGVALAPLALGQRANAGAAFIGDSTLRDAPGPGPQAVSRRLRRSAGAAADRADGARRARRLRRAGRPAPRATTSFPRARVARSPLLAGLTGRRARAAGAGRARRRGPPHHAQRPRGAGARLRARRRGARRSAGAAPRRAARRAAALAVACLAGAVAVVGVARGPELQRDDWRAAVRALGPIAEPRLLVATPAVRADPAALLPAAAARRARRPRSRRPRSTTSPCPCGGPASGRSRRGRRRPVAPGPGYALAGRTDGETFTVLRWRMPAPRRRADRALAGPRRQAGRAARRRPAP